MAYEDIYTYLLKRTWKKATNIYPSASFTNSKFMGYNNGFYATSSVAEFIGVQTASAPPSQNGIIVPPTSENNFLFYVNGDYIDEEGIHIVQTGSDFWLFVDPAEQSYRLSSNDEVFGWGKFES